MRILTEAALFLSFLSPAAAQINFSAGAPPTMSGWGHAPSAAFMAHAGRGFRSYGTAFVGEPWLAGYTEPSAPGAPSVIVLQGAPPARQVEEAKPIEPLTIELQGNRYVRLRETETSARTTAPLDYAETTIARPQKAGQRASEAAAQPESRAQQKPTVLVYRDGHREEIAAYSIVGATLYASNDFWSNGSWTKKIRISALDLPATIKANQAGGVKFELPSGPNVVIARF
jgi:hypothetical protein